MHLIIDEIGHCAFDKENTRLFFDLIDRRYNKEGSFNMIFTSNKNPALWREDFEEDEYRTNYEICPCRPYCCGT